MEDNPWQVDSVQAFSFLKCPECIFDTQEEDFFQVHAIENHPLSYVLFGKTSKKYNFNESLTIEDDLKTEDAFENFDIVKLELAGCKQGLHRAVESLP